MPSVSGQEPGTFAFPNFVTSVRVTLWGAGWRSVDGEAGAGGYGIIADVAGEPGELVSFGLGLPGVTDGSPGYPGGGTGAGGVEGNPGGGGYSTCTRVSSGRLLIVAGGRGYLAGDTVIWPTDLNGPGPTDYPRRAPVIEPDPLSGPDYTYTPGQDGTFDLDGPVYGTGGDSVTDGTLHSGAGGGGWGGGGSGGIMDETYLVSGEPFRRYVAGVGSNGAHMVNEGHGASLYGGTDASTFFAGHYLVQWDDPPVVGGTWSVGRIKFGGLTVPET